jgi:hypothetical protein
VRSKVGRVRDTAAIGTNTKSYTYDANSNVRSRKTRNGDTAPHPDARGDTPSETEAEQQRRIAREAEGIARARASIAAGYYATSAEVDAWIDSLGSDNPLPVPYPRHPRPR